ncbi:MAG TPA: InlB B-repeat-containing protein, partial [Acidimicrobiales bacterium]|nr:InlB B-repeat-containing protein [Acidimicrobiales bacterium]
QYTLTYSGNGNTAGSAPSDPSRPYYSGTSATVLANTGNLVDTGYTFGGWNSAANGSGTSYSAGATLTISADTVLYAVWTPTHSRPSSPPSSSASTAPGPPQTPSGSIANGSGDITWQPPASSGGGAITNYTVTNASGEVVCTTTSLGCTVSGLTGTGPFTFSITATNAYGTSAKVTLTIHLSPATCGSAGAPRCAPKTITIGVVFFAEGQFSIGARSHATLVVAAHKIREDHITRVSIVATSDNVYLKSYNRELSLRRAKATERGLEALLVHAHYRVARFVLSARGVSTKYRGLAANRRATITGVVTSS